MDTMNGHEEDMEIPEEKKPGTVKRLTKVTFTVGPIHQEDLAAAELNRLISLAERFSITFDTITILDSEQTDRLGYVTLPFEIRTKTFLVHIYEKLSKLHVGNRDMSIKMPEELTRHVDEVKAQLEEQKQKRRELAQQKAEQRKKCLFATYVDQDSGELSLKEKFPDATDVTLTEHKEQWYGTMEFESAEKASEIYKATKEVEIDSKKVKIVRTPPDEMDKPRPSPQQNKPKSAYSRGGGGGNRGGRGGYQPRPLLGGGGGMGFPPQQRGGFSGGMGGGRYDNYGGNYQGGYGGMGGGFGGGGGWQLGAKRKGDMGGDYDRNPKKPYGGGGRGGYGGGRGGWGGFSSW